MNWNCIVIVDNKGERHEGEAAKEFVESHCPLGIVNTYDTGVIAVVVSKKSGRKSVKPYKVEAVLWKHLANKVRTIDVSYPETNPADSFMPRRRTGNPIDVKPQYRITFRLGDIDALFAPINAGLEPHTQKGVQQRLQVLGYLYTPLKHSKIDEHAKKCWEYYKFVHQQKRGANLANAQLLDLLKSEIQNNILASKRPASGDVLTDTELPGKDDFAAIRFPGAYCLNYPRPGGKDDWVGELADNSRKPGERPTDADAAYDFSVLDDTYKAEAAVVKDNPLLGKIPLVATVEVKYPKQTDYKPAPGVYVYFQLTEPGILPDMDPLRAPDPRNTVMDYALDPGAFDRWQKEAPEISRSIKVSDEVYEGEVKVKDAEFRDETSTPAQSDWVRGKKLASDIVKAAYKESEAAVQKAEEKEKQAKNDLKKTSDDWAVKNKAAIAAEQAYKSYEQTELSNLDENYKAADKLRVVAEEERDQVAGRLRLLELKTKPPAKSTLRLPEPKTQADADRRKQQAEERERKRQEELKILGSQIEQTRADLAAAEDKARIANERQLEAKREYDEAAKDLESRYPEKKALDDARQEKKIADTELGNAKRKVEDCEKDTKDVVLAARNKKAVELMENETDAVRTSTKYVLAEAAKVLDRTTTLYRYLLANHGDDEIRFPYEIPNAGPKRFVDDVLKKVEKDAGPDDPQRRNAPKQHCGKGGLPVGGNIFETTYRQRFTDGHGTYGPMSLAEKAPDEAEHPYAVRAKTNDQGRAGVIFMPSRCGGDMYRLRAYIGPEVMGKRVDGPEVITGAMVVWRNIRIYRYLQKKNVEPVEFSSDVKQLIEWPAKEAKGYTGSKTWNEVSEKMFLNTPLVKIDFGPGWTPEAKYLKTDSLKGEGGFRPVDVDFISFSSSFNQCYCEVIMDTTKVAELNDGRHGKAIVFGLIAAEKALLKAIDEDEKAILLADKGVQDAKREQLQAQLALEADNRRLEDKEALGILLPDSEQAAFDEEKAAIKAELEQAKARALKAKAGVRKKESELTELKEQKTKNVHWDSLIFHDQHSPFFLNLRHYEHYNSLIKNLPDSERAQYPPLTAADTPKIKTAIDPAMINEMLRYFADGGLGPGLTLVQAARGDSWDQHAISDQPIFSSGIAAPGRVAFIFYTEGAHRSDKFGYSATCNAVHELGHVLMGEHQDSIPGGDPHKHQPQPRTRATPSTDQVACVMGYMGGYGEFCGRCLLRLRGWKTKSILTQDGV
jgi:hypothetical protein